MKKSTAEKTVNYAKPNEVQQIVDYLKSCGGAAQFHYLGNICLSTKEEDNNLYQIVTCKRDSNNPWGIKDKPYKLTTLMYESLLEEIIKD